MAGRLASLLVPLAALAPSSLAREPRFLVLGPHVDPWDVSADGSVVVGDVDVGTFGSNGFRWTEEEGIVLLDPPADSENIVTIVHGVSADGAVVVGVHNDGRGPQAFRWTFETGMVLLGDLPGGPVLAHAYAASHDGSVVVGFGTSEHSELYEAFRWTSQTGMVGLGDLPGLSFSSWAQDITPDGSVIVGESIGERGVEAFRWTSERGMRGIGHFPGGSWTSGCAVSVDGRTLVGAGVSSNGWEAFRWAEEERIVGLGDLPGANFQSFAWDVSGDGRVVIGLGYPEGPPHNAFIWDPERGMRSLADALTYEYGLDISEWWVIAATAISADGRTIVGGAVHRSIPDDTSHGFVAFLGDPPCPADLNDDRTIDERDLMVLLGSFGLDARGDTDNDADTDLTDLAVLLSVYGTPCP